MPSALCGTLRIPPWNIGLPALQASPHFSEPDRARQFFKKSLIRRGLRRAGWAGGEGAAQGSFWNERPVLKGSEWPLITPWCSGAVLFSRKDLCSWSQWGTFLLINRGHPTYSETTFQQAHQPQWPRSPGGNVLRGGSRCTLGSQVSSIDTPGPA